MQIGSRACRMARLIQALAQSRTSANSSQARPQRMIASVSALRHPLSLVSRAVATRTVQFASTRRNFL